MWITTSHQQVAQLITGNFSMEVNKLIFSKWNATFTPEKKKIKQSELSHRPAGLPRESALLQGCSGTSAGVQTQQAWQWRSHHAWWQSSRAGSTPSRKNESKHRKTKTSMPAATLCSHFWSTGSFIHSLSSPMAATRGAGASLKVICCREEQTCQWWVSIGHHKNSVSVWACATGWIEVLEGMSSLETSWSCDRNCQPFRFFLHHHSCLGCPKSRSWMCVCITVSSISSIKTCPYNIIYIWTHWTFHRMNVDPKSAMQKYRLCTHRSHTIWGRGCRQPPTFTSVEGCGRIWRKTDAAEKYCSLMGHFQGEYHWLKWSTLWSGWSSGHSWHYLCESLLTGPKPSNPVILFTFPKSLDLSLGSGFILIWPRPKQCHRSEASVAHDVSAGEEQHFLLLSKGQYSPGFD